MVEEQKQNNPLKILEVAPQNIINNLAKSNLKFINTLNITQLVLFQNYNLKTYTFWNILYYFFFKLSYFLHKSIFFFYNINVLQRKNNFLYFYPMQEIKLNLLNLQTNYIFIYFNYFINNWNLKSFIFINGFFLNIKKYSLIKNKKQLNFNYFNYFSNNLKLFLCLIYIFFFL